MMKLYSFDNSDSAKEIARLILEEALAEPPVRKLLDELAANQRSEVREKIANAFMLGAVSTLAKMAQGHILLKQGQIWKRDGLYQFEQN